MLRHFYHVRWRLPTCGCLYTAVMSCTHRCTAQQRRDVFTRWQKNARHALVNVAVRWLWKMTATPAAACRCNSHVCIKNLGGGPFPAAVRSPMSANTTFEILHAWSLAWFETSGCPRGWVDPSVTTREAWKGSIYRPPLPHSTACLCPCTNSQGWFCVSTIRRVIEGGTLPNWITAFAQFAS